ncbi:MAG: hypothetical protein ACK4MV_16505 [Beijerinckiaceae bacterium]
MSSPFDAAMRAADAAIDKTFAEQVRVEPQSGGEYVRTSDPDRPSYTAMMIVGFSSDTVRFGSMGRLDGDMPQLAADEVHVWAREVELPGDRVLWPRAFDRLVMTARPDEHALTIVAVEPDGIGRYRYRCTRSPLS